MDINYIILAHRHPSQLERLVRRLSAPATWFYIHIDNRCSVEPFQTVLADFENVFFLEKRESGTWGDIGIVTATCYALQEVLNDKRNGYCILLSGQDYPVKSPEQIRKVLEKNNGTLFADTWSLPCNRWHNGGLYRVQFYKYNVPYNGRHYMLVPPLFTKSFFEHPLGNGRKVWKLIRNGKIPFRLLQKRKSPAGIVPYGGSQWWAVTTAVAQEIISFSRRHKSYVKFHRYTLLADEVFFQSLIVYIAKKENILIKPSLTYVRFNEGEPHPVTFSTKHIDDLKMISIEEPEKLFARKFNPDDDVLDMIDQFL